MVISSINNTADYCVQKYFVKATSAPRSRGLLLCACGNMRRKLKDFRAMLRADGAEVCSRK
jgi:hypothetical protein